MANVKISELPSTGSGANAQELPIVDGGVTKRITRQNFSRQGFSLTVMSSDSYSNDAVDVLINTGSDAGATLNTWITAVNAAGGGTIKLLDGTYNVSTSIAMLPDVTLEGNGNATVLVWATPTVVNLIDMTSATRSKLANFQIDMNATLYPTSYTSVLDNNDTSNFYEDILIRNITVPANASNQFIGFNTCVNLVSCEVRTASGTAPAGSLNAGFHTCKHLVDCRAFTLSRTSGVDILGFYNCENLTNCQSGGCDVGFNTCDYLSACKANNNINGSAHGFEDCTRLSACFSSANGTDGFHDCVGLTNCQGSTNGNYGFLGCTHMGYNRANGNTTGQYNTSFADFGGTQAVADTATGGYNG